MSYETFVYRERYGALELSTLVASIHCLPEEEISPEIDRYTHVELAIVEPVEGHGAGPWRVPGRGLPGCPGAEFWGDDVVGCFVPQDVRQAIRAWLAARAGVPLVEPVRWAR